jgi:small acid-soluble spore protein D (minor alpha/beta-type SASP)
MCYQNKQGTQVVPCLFFVFKIPDFADDNIKISAHNNSRDGESLSKTKRKIQNKEKNNQTGDKIMASNKTLVPEAKEALEKFKMEAASEVGVNLTQGYNGDLTSRQAGSVGGQMVKKMIESYENSIKNNK